MKTKYEYIKTKMGICLSDCFSDKVKHMSDSFEKLIMDAFAEGYHKGLVEGFQSGESSRKKGKWLDRASESDADFKRHDFVCSECAHRANYFVGGSEDWWDMEKPKYCPNCGARMEGGDSK